MSKKKKKKKEIEGPELKDDADKIYMKGCKYISTSYNARKI